MIIVTNSALCRDDFYQRIDFLVKHNIHALILREKNLAENQLNYMATKIKQLCDNNNVDMYISNNIALSKKLDCKCVHVSYDSFVDNSKYLIDNFHKISVAIHSVEQAINAQQLGANSIVAGNIFETLCKKGLPGKGLTFVKQLSDNLSIQINSIGGIDANNFRQVINSGADHVCIMSKAMLDNFDSLKNFIHEVNSYDQKH